MKRPVRSIADADLIVAGAPVIAFRLATDSMRETHRRGRGEAPASRTVTHPSMRGWLARLPAGQGYGRRVRDPGPLVARWSDGCDRAWPRGGRLRRVAKGRKFFVTGRYGPLRDGELEAAHAWGSELSHTLEPTT